MSASVLRLFGITLLVFGLMLAFRMSLGAAFVGADFTQDYSAAKSFLSGGSLYGEEVSHVARDVLGARGIENFHPPFMSLLFIPFTILSYPDAFLLWNIFSLILYTALLFMVCSLYNVSDSHRLPLVGICLSWYPFLCSMALGQTSILIAFLIVIAWKYVHQEKYSVAGISIGLATLLKLFPGFLALFFLKKNRSRGFLSFSITVFLGLIISGVVIGIDDYHYYLTHIMGSDIKHWGTYPVNISIAGLILPLVGEGKYVSALPVSYQTGYLLWVVFFLLVATLSIYQGIQTQDKEKSFYILLCAMILLSPVMWQHMLVVMILPLVYIFTQNSQEQWRRVFTLLIFCLFAIDDISFVRFLTETFSPETVPASVYLLTRFHTLGVVFCWLYFVLPIYTPRQ